MLKNIVLFNFANAVNSNVLEFIKDALVKIIVVNRKIIVLASERKDCAQQCIVSNVIIMDVSNLKKSLKN